MTRRIALVLVGTMFAVLAPASAQDRSPFYALNFNEHQQYTLTCAARYECDIQLEAGERVNDGFNAHIDQWDPHVGYSGDKEVTPHLVLRPSRTGLRTNIILTTTKRTYYLLAISTDIAQPSYYSFRYVDESYKDLAALALATQTALRASGGSAQPVATATPADVANLSSVCFDFDYSYLVDPNAQSDHAPRARPSSDALPREDVPQVVCSDGSHTYIEFPLQREVPSDLPISLGVTAEGDTLMNYTYTASLNRFTVDGVYDSFVLELGSQSRPLRLRIYHAGRGNPPNGKRSPRPLPVVPAGNYAQSPALVIPSLPSYVQPTAESRRALAPIRPAVTPESTTPPDSFPATPSPKPIASSPVVPPVKRAVIPSAIPSAIASSMPVPSVASNASPLPVASPTPPAHVTTPAPSQEPSKAPN